jgi:hypothetical protein
MECFDGAFELILRPTRISRTVGTLVLAWMKSAAEPRPQDAYDEIETRRLGNLSLEIPTSGSHRLMLPEISLELHPSTKPRFDPLDNVICDLPLPANVAGRANENAKGLRAHSVYRSSLNP